MARVKDPRDMKDHPEDWAQTSGRGLEVVIEEVRLGRQGTGIALDYDASTDDTFYDETRHGSSVWYVDTETGRHGRLVTYDYLADWEVIGQVSDQAPPARQPKRKTRTR